MAAINIPPVTNWSVTPQNGQEDYFIKMNTWLSESTSVIASLNTAIVKINESNTQNNNNLVEVIEARNITVAAKNEAVTAIATLTAGAIDDTTIATNKAFSNSYIQANYYDKDEVDTAISEATLDINSLTDKPIPINTDNMVIQEVGGLLKKLSWDNLKTTLLSFFGVKISSDGFSIKNATGGTIKNQCTAWVVFDGSTTPPTIKDSYSVGSVVRSVSGKYAINLLSFDNANYCAVGMAKDDSANGRGFLSIEQGTAQTKDSIHITMYSIPAGVFVNSSLIEVVFFGGKN